MRKPDKQGDGQLRQLSAGQREEAALRAAKLYYELDRTQAEIGRELGLTRFQVARLLREARESGLVRIEIVPASNRRPALEAELQRAFGLKEAIVVGLPGGAYDALSAVARAAAAYLVAISPSPRLIGVSWGRTMSAVAERLPRGWNDGVEVVLLNGATHLRSTDVPTNDVAERFAVAGRGTAVLLPVPAIVGQPGTRAALEADPIIRRVLRRGREAPIACFGLGIVGVSSVLVESGYVDGDTMSTLRDRGAVGDILGRVVDRDGIVVDDDLDRRTIGLPLEELRTKQLSIGISAGQAKHEIVLAALQARFVNVLVTDQATAEHAIDRSG